MSWKPLEPTSCPAPKGHTHTHSHTLPQGWLMSDRAQGLLLQTPELLEEELRVVIDNNDNRTATGSFFLS